MSELTGRQVDCLTRLNLSGGRCSTSYVGRFPASCATTYRTLRRLESLGFVDRQQTAHWPYWSITDAGRRALSQPGANQDLVENNNDVG